MFVPMILEGVPADLYLRATFLHPLRSSSTVPFDETLYITDPSTLRDDTCPSEQAARQLVYGVPPPHASSLDRARRCEVTGRKSPLQRPGYEEEEWAEGLPGGGGFSDAVRELRHDRHRRDRVLQPRRGPRLRLGVGHRQSDDLLGLLRRAGPGHTGSAWGRARPSAARVSLPCRWRRWRR